MAGGGLPDRGDRAMSAGERTVRPATIADQVEWARLRTLLWPEEPGVHAREIAESFGAGSEDDVWPMRAWLAELDGAIIGFAEASIRPYAEGCETRAIGYLEGWFVESAHRGTGVGRALVEAAEDWARSRGCTEMASDAEPESDISRAAHTACGFRDVGLVRCFAKRI